MKTPILLFSLALGVFTTSIPPQSHASDLLDNWTWRNPLPTGNSLLAVAGNGNQYVGVGYAGTVVTSPDGDDWRLEPPPLNTQLTGIAWHDGLFVAVGDNGKILTSPDGVTWTPRASGTTGYFTGVVWGGDRFVAVGSAIAAWSTNGLAWNQAVTDAPLVSVAYGAGLYVAVGHGASIQTSTNGVTWTPRNPGVDGPLWSVAFGGGVFVIAGSDSGNGFLLSSTNGVAWTKRVDRAGTLRSVAYGNGRFFAVDLNGNHLASTDGLSWTHATAPRMLLVSFANSRFVGWDWGMIATSTDGNSWSTHSTTGTRGYLRGEGVFVNGRFVVVGSSIVTSPDGQTWTEQNPGISDPFLQGLTHGKDLFVTVGSGGTILTSPDGTQWAKQGSGTTYFLKSVTYGSNLFLALGADGSETQLAFLTSTNGTNWTISAQAGGWLSSLAYGDDLFVAVGDGGTIRTSTNGITWTTRSSGTTEGLRKVIFGKNLFVAVGANGTIVTSPNGTSWTRRLNTGQFTDDFRSVAFGGGVFVAVGWYGPPSSPVGPLFVSTNGMQWTSRTQLRQGLDMGVHGICYGQGQFIAFADGGAILGCDVRPRLGKASFLADGTPRIPISGVTGLGYLIEASNDLTDWSTLTTASVPSGSGAFFDVAATNSNQRFYRAVSPP